MRFAQDGQTFMPARILMMTTIQSELPWPELKIPTYRPAALETWALQKCEHIMQMGYFQDWRGQSDIYALLHNGESWMSTALDELESQAPHVSAAKGHVVIMGAGMGVALYNILAKPDVTHVTVVEHDLRVIHLLRQATDIDSWVGIEKLGIEIVDAFDYLPVHPVDHLYVDIWARPGDPQALAHTQQIQKHLNAKTVGWWTQEIEFLDWLERKGCGVVPTMDLFRQWVGEIGLPLIEQNNPAYLACIAQVARSYCYQMVSQGVSQPTVAPS
jgi:hypothetical protein